MSAEIVFTLSPDRPLTDFGSAVVDPTSAVNDPNRNNNSMAAAVIRQLGHHPTKRSHVMRAANLFTPVVVVVVAFTLAVERSHGQTPGFRHAGKMLKTTPSSGDKGYAFIQAIQDLDRDLAAAKGAELRDKRQRLQMLRGLAESIKADATSLLSRIRANKEEKEYDAMVVARAQAASPVLAAEIQSAGGAAAMLSTVARRVDADMQLVQKELHAENDMLVLRWLAAILSVRDAEGTIREFFCTGFWFTISLGYGTEHAYTSCYR